MNSIGTGRRLSAGKSSPWTLLAVFTAGLVIGNVWRFFPDPDPASADAPAHQHPALDRQNPGPAAMKEAEDSPASYPDLSGTTPPDLDTMWQNSVKNSSSERELLTDLKGIAASMAAEGRALEAMEKALAALGPGNSRCEVIRAIFQGAADPASLGPSFSLLEHDDEKNFAVQGLAERLAFADSPDKVDFGKFAYLGERLDPMKATVVSTYILQHSIVGQIESSGPFGKSIGIGLSEASEKAVIADVVSVVPFSCWDHVMQKGFDPSGIDRDRIITEMVRLDPPAAVERIRAAPKADVLFNTAFTEWMRKDATKPIEWITANASTLSAAQRDRAYQGISRYAAQQGDLSTARQWAGMITDEGVKDDISGEAWMKEAKDNH